MSVPTIYLNGDVIIGWGPQTGREILEKLSKARKQGGET